MSEIDRRLQRAEAALAARTPAAPVDQPADRVRVPVPNIIEFVTSPEYLDRPLLYPEQATLLKVVCLEVDLLTDFDSEVIAEWESGFQLVHDDAGARYEGTFGTAPGVVERMRACKATGRPWFAEIVLVLGRRAGKGYLTSLLAAYQIYTVLALGDPQTVLGLERTKQLAVMVFGTEKETAKFNLFSDLSKLIQSAPCFAPYRDASTTSSLRLFTPRQLQQGAADPQSRQPGSLVIDARASTGTAGRGPAALGLFLDEMAHLPGPGLDRSGDEVYRASRPALAQFPTLSMTVMTSSPADQLGQFYASHLQALKAHPDGRAVDPTVFTLQLPSWELYRHWKETNRPDDHPEGPLLLWPGGPAFETLSRPIITEESLATEFIRDPDSASVEYAAQWRTSASAYLKREHVEAAFTRSEQWQLKQFAAPILSNIYAIHVDLSSVGCNTGIAIGHRVDRDGERHLVFDYLEAVSPAEQPSGVIDYSALEDNLFAYILRYRPAWVTFDQYQSQQMVQSLGRRVRQARFDQMRVDVRTATAASNWEIAELFKRELQAGHIHAPVHELARLELLHLQRKANNKIDCPTYGPVKSKDLADAMFGVVASLCDPQLEVQAEMSALDPVFAQFRQFGQAAAGRPGPGLPRSGGGDSAARGGRFNPRRYR